MFVLYAYIGESNRDGRPNGLLVVYRKNYLEFSPFGIP